MQISRRPIFVARLRRFLVVAGTLCLGHPAQAQVFNYLSEPVNVSPGGTSSWVDVDVSANVPAGATGVIIQAYNESSSDLEYGVRMNGSGDTWMEGLTLQEDTAPYLMVGLDANRIFEVWQEDSGTDTFLVGYTTAGVTFFETAKNKSLSSTGSWQEIDISTDTGGDTAIGAIVIMRSTTSSARSYAIQKKGSSDDRYKDLRAYMSTAVMIGVDANEIFRLRIEDTALDTYLMGYVTDGAVFLTNAVDKSLSSSGAYTDIDISSEIGSDGANGAIVEWTTGDDRDLVATRMNGQGHNVYEFSSHLFSFIGVDAGNLFEGKVENTNCDFFLVGYTTIDINNYRSIGTDTGTIYSTGNASISQDAKVVTFASATLPTNIGVGDELVIGAETFHILSRDSATQVTVQDAAAGTHTSAAYTISRAYNDIQSWENGRDGDLVGENRREVGVCYNDGPFTTTTRFNDSTTDSTHYMKLTVAENQRHNGTRGSGAMIDAEGGFSNSVIDVQDQYVQIEWLEITNFKDTDRGIYLDESPASDNSDGCTISNLLMYDFNTGNTNAPILIRSNNTVVRNCMIFDGTQAAIWLKEVGTATIENCTIFGITGSASVGDGIKQTAGSNITIRNTISVGNNDDDFDLDGTVDYFDYNMYNNVEGFTPSGSNDQAPPANLDDLFVSTVTDSEDLHLEPSGHAALNTGLDLSSDFEDDIDAETRSAPWDLGADEGLAVNFRSVGTNAAVIYQTGNASISADATVVTFGGGASLPTNIGPGDELVIGAETFYIASRDSTTQVTVQTAASGTHSSAAYTISRAYNTMQAWEDAVDGDLVAEKRREIGVCYHDGAFTDRLVIDGSTTDATHYIKLTVAEGQRHNGIRNSGAVIDAQGGWTAQNAIDVWDEYTWIDGLEIKAIHDQGDAISFANSPSSANGLVSNVYIHSFWQANNAGVRVASTGVTIRNCFITGGTSAGITVALTGGVVIENCTLWGYTGSGHGLQAAGGSIVSVTNTISVAHDSGYDFYIGTGGGAVINYFGYNLFETTAGGFDPDDYDGGNQLPPANLEFLFVTLSSPENLHLEAGGHRAGNTGLDLSSSFSDDIDGVTRTDVWDIGADEGVTGTDPLTPKILAWEEVEP